MGRTLAPNVGDSDPDKRPDDRAAVAKPRTNFKGEIVAHAEECPLCGGKLENAAWSEVSKDVYACVRCNKEWLIEGGPPVEVLDSTQAQH